MYICVLCILYSYTLWWYDNMIWWHDMMIRWHDMMIWWYGDIKWWYSNYHMMIWYDDMMTWYVDRHDMMIWWHNNYYDMIIRWHDNDDYGDMIWCIWFLCELTLSCWLIHARDGRFLIKLEQAVLVNAYHRQHSDPLKKVIHHVSGQVCDYHQL